MNDEIMFYKATVIDLLDNISGEIETIKKAANVMADSIVREDPVHNNLRFLEIAPTQKKLAQHELCDYSLSHVRLINALS